MRCVVILSVILGSADAVSPAAAQVAVASGDSPAAQQPTSADTGPPPFPAMPRARPSSRCVNTCGGKSKSVHRTTLHHERAKSRHSAKSAHHATSSRHRSATARKEAKSHKKTKAREPVLHLSRSAIRRCHNENYRQLMGDSKCRTLMAQELKAKEPHRRGPHPKASSSSKHKGSSQHKKVEHRSTRHNSKHR